MENIVRKNLRQIWAISRLTLQISSRHKMNFIIGIISSIITLLFPIIMFSFIFGNILEGRSIGVFSQENYVSLVFLGSCGAQFNRYFTIYSGRFRMEKRRYTLPALIIAPLNRSNILSGIFISNLILIMPLFSITFSLLIIFSHTIPSIGVILLVYLIFVLYGLILSGLGLILGILVISKQNWVSLYKFFYRMVSIFNCTVFPKEIFPEFFYPIVELNPFYHVFELVRVLWVFNDITYSGNIIHFTVVISLAIISPIVGIYFFNRIYDRYGIQGV